MASGLGMAVFAYTMHCYRIAKLHSNQSFRLSHSVVWVSGIIGITVIALSLELYFGTTYPYLQRAAAVVIAPNDAAVEAFPGNETDYDGIMDFGSL